MEPLTIPYTKTVKSKSSKSYERCEGDKEGVGPDEEEGEQRGGRGGEREVEISALIINLFDLMT